MVRRNFLRSLGAVFAFLSVDSALSKSQEIPKSSVADKYDKDLTYAFKADADRPEALKQKLRELSTKFFEDGRILKIKRVAIKKNKTDPESTLKIFSFKTPEDKIQYLSERAAVVNQFEVSQKLPIA